MKRTSGFTLIEASFVVALLGVVCFKVTMALNSVAQNYQSESSETVLEDQANQVLDKVQLAIQSSNFDSLNPDAFSPNSSSELTYRVTLGVQDGGMVLSDFERIGTDETGSEVVWSENPGAPDERSVTLTTLVAPLLEGELINGVDDNENNLNDEAGLSFNISGRMVTINLTLERSMPDGSLVPYTVSRKATCRN